MCGGTGCGWCGVRSTYVAKKRGGGTTKQHAKASLTWVGAAPSGHAPDGLTRIDEVGRTVERLLGMSKDQFFQVVLLPQGEFARFLCAETAEREKLLEKLFGTQHFALVEQWFRDRRTERGRALEDGRLRCVQLVARLAQAVGEEPPADDSGDETWLAALVDHDARPAAEEAVARELAAAVDAGPGRGGDAGAAGAGRPGAPGGGGAGGVGRAVGAGGDCGQRGRRSWQAARRAAPVVAAQRELDVGGWRMHADDVVAALCEDTPTTEDCVAWPPDTAPPAMPRPRSGTASRLPGARSRAADADVRDESRRPDEICASGRERGT